ncbi:MAG: UTRA domain-containing protein [Pseudomonadota bacterium]
MTVREINGWQAVQSEILNRIQSRQWKPGDLIPNEADLAQEFGCARATVNRALRAIAETGLLERRRKAGTRVTLHPVRRATLSIPIIRQEIEERNHVYAYTLLSAELKVAPAGTRAQMRLDQGARAFKIQAVHFADGKPYVFEDRWVNISTVPAIRTADLKSMSPNEWLVRHASFTDGDIAFTAELADPKVAGILNVDQGAAVFVIERNTWIDGKAVTSVKLTFAPGYRMHTAL